MAYFGQDGDLVVREFAQFGRVLELVNAHDLDCKYLFGLSVFCPIHISVLTLANTLHQNIVLHNLVHLNTIITKAK